VRTPYTEYLLKKSLFETYAADIPNIYHADRSKVRQYNQKTSKLPQADMQSSFVADRAIDWLHDYKSDKPFFLWVSFIEPHPPYIDDPRWADRYKGAKVPLGPVKMPDLPDNAWGRYLGQWIKSTGTAELTPEKVADIERHYYGMVSLVDQKVGDIVKAIDAIGKAKNTWFIYTADHGEMMGDHQMMYKEVFLTAALLSALTLTSDAQPSPGVFGPGPGCNVFPAPASVGATVDLSYFGPPPSENNPSLVGPVQLLKSGQVDLAKGTVTLPLYRGSMAGNGKAVWYILTEASDPEIASLLGLNFSAKLNFAGNGARTANFDSNNNLVFDRGAVDFKPARNVTPAHLWPHFLLRRRSLDRSAIRPIAP